MIKINCFGDICPVPILKINKELPKLRSGETLEVVCDHGCVVESIRDKYQHCDVTIEEVMNGVWEIHIIKN
ncbi:MAG: sulfurtransferase TusA family protein [Firmicutes bacterium HGW-Firmicutes-18]|jgi:TusA-related sulfurtransferase|nr:MAG: sulfurtransferase TusA family protein [Firmicutes bacterium HGW-Firmicutes-18]